MSENERSPHEYRYVGHIRQSHELQLKYHPERVKEAGRHQGDIRHGKRAGEPSWLSEGGKSSGKIRQVCHVGGLQLGWVGKARLAEIAGKQKSDDKSWGGKGEYQAKRK